MVTAEFVAPATAMVCSITAECNANRAFAELQTVNNSASAKFEVTSPYTMTVTTDKNAYNIGETVHLAGKIISSTQAIAGIKVEPYVMYHGARTALEAVTDADGSFAVDYALPQGIGGDFDFGACLPDENAETAVARAGVYGMAKAES